MRMKILVFAIAIALAIVPAAAQWEEHHRDGGWGSHEGWHRGGGGLHYGGEGWRGEHGGLGHEHHGWHGGGWEGWGPRRCWTTPYGRRCRW